MRFASAIRRQDVLNDLSITIVVKDIILVLLDFGKSLFFCLFLLFLFNAFFFAFFLFFFGKALWFATLVVVSSCTIFALFFFHALIFSLFNVLFVSNNFNQSTLRGGTAAHFTKGTRIVVVEEGAHFAAVRTVLVAYLGWGRHRHGVGREVLNDNVDQVVEHRILTCINGLLGLRCREAHSSELFKQFCHLFCFLLLLGS